MLSYNQIYGLRTVGAGSWMSNKLFKKNLTDPFSKVVINSFKKPISLDLKRIGLLKKIKNLEIMDVGTGRQALAFLEMGAKAVDLYDISKNNINKIKKLVKEKKSFKFKRADICKENFNKQKKYDFIYLQGVIHHTKKPKKALINISKASKLSTIVWLYHYQCTSPKNFYVATLRKIFHKDKLFFLFKELYKLNFDRKKIDFLMDDLGCDYIRLLNPNFYKFTMENLGFKQFYKKDVLNIDKGINLNLDEPSCLTAYIKKKSNNLNKKKINNLYKDINVFDYKNYVPKNQKLVKKLNIMNKEIIKYVKNNKIKTRKLIKIFLPLLNGYFEYKKKYRFKKLFNNYQLTMRFLK